MHVLSMRVNRFLRRSSLLSWLIYGLLLLAGIITGPLTLTSRSSPMYTLNPFGCGSTDGNNGNGSIVISQYIQSSQQIGHWYLISSLGLCPAYGVRMIELPKRARLISYENCTKFVEKSYIKVFDGHRNITGILSKPAVLWNALDAALQAKGVELPSSMAKGAETWENADGSIFATGMALLVLQGMAFVEARVHCTNGRLAVLLFFFAMLLGLVLWSLSLYSILHTPQLNPDAWIQSDFFQDCTGVRISPSQSYFFGTYVLMVTASYIFILLASLLYFLVCNSGSEDGKSVIKLSSSLGYFETSHDSEPETEPLIASTGKSNSESTAVI